MAVAVALDVFGLGVGGLCLIEMLKGVFATPADQITTVRVYLGDTGDASASLGGNVPGVTLWDKFGHSIGSTHGTKEKLQQGAFHDIKVGANKKAGNIPADYVSISNGGDDAICIAWLSITYPDGTQSSFTGDIGRQCGARWYLSERQMGTKGETPSCIWIGRKSDDVPMPQGFGVHLPDFVSNQAQATAYSNNLDLMCKSPPRFKMYDQLRTEDTIAVFKPELQYNSDGTDVDPKSVIDNQGAPADKVVNRRSIRDEHSDEAKRYVAYPYDAPSVGSHLPKRIVSNGTVPANGGGNGAAPFSGKLIVSHVEHHSARDLCTSPSSHGPDFVAIAEGLFCDMEKRVLHDVCSQEKTTCCFDVDQHTLRQCVGRNRVRSGATVGVRDDVTVKKYDTVRTWGL